MSRYPSPQPSPVQSSPEGEQGFTSVNMKLAQIDRSLLPPGVLALSVNKRLRHKVAATRDGIWPPVFANILNPTRIRGWGVYSNPNGDEVLLVAGANEVYSIKDGSYPTTLEVDSAMSPVVEFVQAHDKILMFQSEPLKRQLIWDGVDSDGFITLTKNDPLDTSTDIIPLAVTAEHVSDRLVIINGKNTLIVTDILDYTSYDPILETFYVNREGGDAIVRVVDYANGILIVFGSRSTSLLLTFTGDPALARVQLLNSTLGLAGRKAVVMLGGDVLFLSAPGGIYRIAQAFESRLEAIPAPVTDSIQPLIDRINWRAASGVVAEVVGEYVYFFVPIDGSERNNCAIVINGVTGLVEGYDTWPDTSFRVDDVKVTLYNGERRLYALDKQAVRIYVMYEGKSDFVYDPDTEVTTEFHIQDLMETRGYATSGYDPVTRKYSYDTRRDFKRVEIGVSTWAPSLMVTELTESASDERALNVNPITKSRIEYDTFARRDWVETNINDDWATPGRQDYSIVASETGFDPGSGIDPDRKQTSALRFSTKARSRYISYRITNSQGQADITSLMLESTGTQREPRRAG